jgi:EpsI family protein
MPSLKARTAIVLLLLGLAAAASALGLYPGKSERGAKTAAALPLEIGPWLGQELPIPQYVIDILETDDVVQRNYMRMGRAGEPGVEMAIVYSANNRRVAHPPEVCYQGSGWEASSRQLLEAPDLPPLMRVVMTHGPTRDLVLYCYQSGEELTANYYRQQLNIMRNVLRRRATASALIRFSSHITGTEAETQARMLDFVRLMMPEIKTRLSQQTP